MVLLDQHFEAKPALLFSSPLGKCLPELSCVSALRLLLLANSRTYPREKCGVCSLAEWHTGMIPHASDSNVINLKPTVIKYKSKQSKNT